MFHCSTVQCLNNLVCRLFHLCFSDHCLSYVSLVQFWYSSNYHWFLKQEIKFEEDDCVGDLCWDAESALKCHILTKTGRYLFYQFSWEIFQSYGHHANNDASIGMIDGGNVCFHSAVFDRLLSVCFSMQFVTRCLCTSCYHFVKSFIKLT